MMCFCGIESAASMGKLGREDVDLFDGRRLCEELRRVCRERGDAARQVSVPPPLAREGVEDTCAELL
jgi:hypothetical protein